MTFQLTGLVVWPVLAKSSLPLAVSTWVIAVVISLATLFHGILLFKREVVAHYCPDEVDIVSHRYLSKSPRKYFDFTLVFFSFAFQFFIIYFFSSQKKLHAFFFSEHLKFLKKKLSFFLVFVVYNFS